MKITSTAIFMSITGTVGLSLGNLISPDSVPDLHLLIWLGLSMLLDFIFGFTKAVVLRKARTSGALRKTVLKFIQYFGAIIIVFIMMNVVGKSPYSNLVPIVDFLSSAIIILLIYVEVVSVLENLNEIDSTSTLSKMVFKPLHKILTIQIGKFKLESIDSKEDE